MMQQFRGLLIALVLLGVLGAGVYWSNKDTKEKEGKPAADAPPKILEIPEAEIMQVEIRKSTGEPTVIKRTGDGPKWLITAPKELRADPDAVTPMVNLLASLGSESLVDDKVQEWATYGLKDPVMQIIVTRKDGKTSTLQLGDELPAGSALYARIAGESKLFTLATFNKGSIDKTWKDLRDKRLLTVESDKLSRMEFSSAKGSGYEFGKNQSGEWQVIKPSPFRADNFAVEEAGRKLREVKMDPNLSDDEAGKAEKAFAGAAVAGIAKLTDATGTQQLEIRKTKDKEPVYYAKSSAVEGVHKVGADVAAVLEKTVDDYRNKKLFDFGFSDPSKVEVKMDGKVFSYGKNGDKWFRDGKEMKPETVQNVIDKLRDLGAVKFTSGSKETPSIDISVVWNEGKKTDVVHIAGTLAARGDEPYQYDVGASAVDELKKAVNEIQPAEAAKPAATPQDGKKK